MHDPLPSTLTPSPDVETTSVGDRAVLFHRGTGEALVLNPTGSFLWSRLVGGVRTSGELAQLLASEHRLESTVALSDTRTFLTSLSDLKLVCDSVEA